MQEGIFSEINTVPTTFGLGPGFDSSPAVGGSNPQIFITTKWPGRGSTDTVSVGGVTPEGHVNQLFTVVGRKDAGTFCSRARRTTSTNELSPNEINRTRGCMITCIPRITPTGTTVSVGEQARLPTNSRVTNRCRRTSCASWLRLRPRPHTRHSERANSVQQHRLRPLPHAIVPDAGVICGCAEQDHVQCLHRYAGPSHGTVPGGQHSAGYG